VSEPVEATDCREPPVDRRCGEPSLLHRASTELNVGAGGSEHFEVVVESPLETMRRSCRYASSVRPLQRRAPGTPPSPVEHHRSGLPDPGVGAHVQLSHSKCPH
jgi:hypothetical protein